MSFCQWDRLMKYVDQVFTMKPREEEIGEGDGNSLRSTFDDAGLKLLIENIYREQFGVKP